MTKSWDRYWFDMAEVVASKSKDPDTQVGAVIVGDGNSTISTGYNGFPRGVEDGEGPRYERPTKYIYTEHAERNAICAAARLGHSTNGCHMYVTSWVPCADCTRAIIQAGISVVHVRKSCAEQWLSRDKWGDQAIHSEAMLSEARVRVRIVEEM